MDWVERPYAARSHSHKRSPGQPTSRSPVLERRDTNRAPTGHCERWEPVRIALVKASESGLQVQRHCSRLNMERGRLEEVASDNRIAWEEQDCFGESFINQ